MSEIKMSIPTLGIESDQLVELVKVHARELDAQSRIPKFNELLLLTPAATTQGLGELSEKYPPNESDNIHYITGYRIRSEMYFGCEVRLDRAAEHTDELELSDLSSYRFGLLVPLSGAYSFQEIFPKGRKIYAADSYSAETIRGNRLVVDWEGRFPHEEFGDSEKQKHLFLSPVTGLYKKGPSGRFELEEIIEWRK